MAQILLDYGLGFSSEPKIVRLTAMAFALPKIVRLTAVALALCQTRWCLQGGF